MVEGMPGLCRLGGAAQWGPRPIATAIVSGRDDQGSLQSYYTFYSCLRIFHEGWRLIRRNFFGFERYGD
jgi:hypothetical protein